MKLAQDISLAEQDIINAMTMVGCEDTPAFSMIPKGRKVWNTTQGWPHDVPLEPRDNAITDGEDTKTFEDATPDVDLLYSRMQTLERASIVSEDVEEIYHEYGIEDQIAYAKAKHLVGIKLDTECAICSDTEATEGTSTSKSKLRGLGKWVLSTAQAYLPVPAQFRTPAASIDTTPMATLTSAIIDGVLDSIWDQTGSGKRFVGLCGRVFQAKFKDFTQTKSADGNAMSSIRTYSQDATSKKIVNTVTVYEGDSGTLELIRTKWNAKFTSAAAAARRCYVFTPDNLELSMNKGFTFKDLPDGGAGPRFNLRAKLLLRVKSPMIIGKFAAAT